MGAGPSRSSSGTSWRTAPAAEGRSSPPRVERTRAAAAQEETSRRVAAAQLTAVHRVAVARLGLAESGPVTVERVEAGGTHNCALLSNGAVRCWGNPSSGQLGYGNTEAIGDDPGDAPAPLSRATFPTVGVPWSCPSTLGRLVCASTTGAVRCWGRQSCHRLPGIGRRRRRRNARIVGDVELGEPAEHIETGALHTCAILSGGRLRCWGEGDSGRTRLRQRRDHRRRRDTGFCWRRTGSAASSST